MKSPKNLSEKRTKLAKILINFLRMKNYTSFKSPRQDLIVFSERNGSRNLVKLNRNQEEVEPAPRDLVESRLHGLARFILCTVGHDIR